MMCTVAPYRLDRLTPLRGINCCAGSRYPLRRPPMDAANQDAVRIEHPANEMLTWTAVAPRNAIPVQPLFNDPGLSRVPANSARTGRYKAAGYW